MYLQIVAFDRAFSEVLKTFYRKRYLFFYSFNWRNKKFALPTPPGKSWFTCKFSADKEKVFEKFIVFLFS